MHPLVWDENSFVPRVLGVAGSSMPSVGSLVPGAGSGAGLLDPYGWASLGVVAPALPSAQGAGGVPVLPDSLVGGNPVLLVDPWGLSPVSVEDFEKYREQKGSSGITGWVKRTATDVASGAVTLWNQGKKLYQAATNSAKDLWNKATTAVKVGWDKTKKWVGENWEYLAGGAMVIAGIGISALSVAGGPLTMVVFGALGGAISSAGMSMITQKAQHGSVDMGEMLKDAAIGAVIGGITGGIGGRILAGARDVAGVTPKVSKLASKVAEKTDWKWANNLIRKAVDYKPWTSLKGTSGVADDVAMMAPVREAKEFLSHRVGQFMKPGQHKAVFSSGWWHNQAVSQLTTSQPIKYAVKYGVKHAVNNFVPALSAGVTSLRHHVEEAPDNQQNGNGSMKGVGCIFSLKS